jgi:hypothetical protein
MGVSGQLHAPAALPPGRGAELKHNDNFPFTVLTKYRMYFTCQHITYSVCALCYSPRHVSSNFSQKERHNRDVT